MTHRGYLLEAHPTVGRLRRADGVGPLGWTVWARRGCAGSVPAGRTGPRWRLPCRSWSYWSFRRARATSPRRHLGRLPHQQRPLRSRRTASAWPCSGSRTVRQPSPCPAVPSRSAPSISPTTSSWCFPPRVPPTSPTIFGGLFPSPDSRSLNRIRVSRPSGSAATAGREASPAPPRPRPSCCDRCEVGRLVVGQRSGGQKEVQTSPRSMISVRSSGSEMPTTLCGSPSMPVTNGPPRPSTVKAPATWSGSPVAT